jgi:hypothetical protein
MGFRFRVADFRFALKESRDHAVPRRLSACSHRQAEGAELKKLEFRNFPQRTLRLYTTIVEIVRKLR